MASIIFLGEQEQGIMDASCWNIELNTDFRGAGYKAIISKGNVIEGIEAKE